ncbi:DUF4124 domain-containing protein [Thalassotalea castellviae]|uniref:DUF4124 domain-containing protein n=1 Tax=Thalassotalea castellviae TaxID=3075612 RepID=A0ABU3A7T4_9GAMM|nr:DUF4124 domain-containing protein [Thalassotalea sp. W431]MDT0605158.1 DUF4124 domain-containing protein [Thalassotalea sp. W431]
MTNLKLFVVMILTIVISLPISATSTKIYVWRNADGVLVYSDSPKPGAEEVDVKEPNNMSSSIDTSILDINPKTIEEKYQVEISQPANNATIRDNTGSVYVSGRIKPIFKQGLKIQLKLDNQPYEKPQTHSMFVLRNVERGEHQLKMDLINDKGKVIASSEPVTFYMHRASVIRAN